VFAAAWFQLGPEMREKEEEHFFLELQRAQARARKPRPKFGLVLNIPKPVN